MNKCIICGKETKNKKYCSINCKSVAMSKEKSKCLNCNKLVDRCEKKYCSQDCYIEHKKLINLNKSILFNKCIICGKETKNEKYCSMDCLGKDKSRIDTALKNLKNEHIWTDSEIDFLRKNYGKMNLNDLEKKLNIKKESIIAYASKHKIKSIRKWTPEEIEYLKNNNSLPIDVLSKNLNRSYSSITNKFAVINGFQDKNGKSIISPQKYVTNYIKSLNIPYLEEVSIGKFKTDILVYFLDIEIQGTYWHCDERFFKKENLNELQKSRIDKDIRKEKYLKSLNIEIMYIWEYDLLSNPQETLHKINNKLIELNLLKGRPNSNP